MTKAPDAHTAETQPFEGPGIESVSGQTPYSLPRDHAYHGVKFYQTNDYSEGQHITILGFKFELTIENYQTITGVLEHGTQIAFS